MNTVQKVSVALTPDMAALAKQAVADGEYGSTSEVVREALREWASRRKRHDAELALLKTAWKQGIASGAGRFTDIENLLDHAKNLKKKQ